MKFSLQYAIRLVANSSNSTFIVTFLPHISQEIIDLNKNEPSAVKPFGFRIEPPLTPANNKEKNETHSVSEIPSQCL